MAKDVTLHRRYTSPTPATSLATSEMLPAGKHATKTLEAPCSRDAPEDVSRLPMLLRFSNNGEEVDSRDANQLRTAPSGTFAGGHANLGPRLLRNGQ